MKTHRKFNLRRIPGFEPHAYTFEIRGWENYADLETWMDNNDIDYQFSSVLLGHIRFCITSNTGWFLLAHEVTE